jgi:hypothetical protein
MGKNGAVTKLNVEGTRGDGGAHSGGGETPRPPRLDFNSREALEHRERQGAPKLGLLWRARTRKLLSGRQCLGGRGR